MKTTILADFQICISVPLINNSMNLKQEKQKYSRLITMISARNPKQELSQKNK